MYCQKCGAQVNDQAAARAKCGTAPQKPPPGISIATDAYPAATQYAGFWRRVGAFVIDWLIVAAAQTVIQVILVWTGVIDMNALENNPSTHEARHSLAVCYLLVGALFMAQMLCSAIMESSSKQATLGKMVLGIVVTDNDGRRISFGRALGRNLAKIVSGIILFIGFLMGAFTEKKQGLHDMIANCLVVVRK